MRKSTKTPRTTVERVIQVLLEDIREGRYRSGDKVIAHEVAKEMKLSRAPVREAIHILAGQGVLELPPRRSARVRRLSAQDILHICEMLKAIGGLAVRLAGQRIAIGNNSERVREAMATLRESANSGEPMQLLKAIDAYVLVLEDIAENPYLQRARESMHFEHLHRTMLEEADLWYDHVEMFVDDLQGITDALLDGEFEKAEALYRKHVGWAVPILRSRVEENSEDALYGVGG